MSVSAYAERPEVAVSRRSGDEIHPWLPNGGLRPRLCEKSGVMSPVGKILTKPPLFEVQSHSSSRFTAKRKGKLKSFPTASLRTDFSHSLGQKWTLRPIWHDQESCLPFICALPVVLPGVPSAPARFQPQPPFGRMPTRTAPERSESYFES